MKLLDYTTPASFLPRLQCRDLEEVVTRLVAGLAAAGGVSDPVQLVADVLRRERGAATAIGGGLVVPHARSSAVSRLQMAVATQAEPLLIQAEDQQPVDVVVLIVAPPHEQRLLLRLLARLARLVKDPTFLSGLRQAESAAEMERVLADTS